MAYICQNCSRPATYQVGNGATFCVDCYHKIVQIESAQSQERERVINYLQDQMASITGLPRMGPRFPPRPPSHFIQAGTTTLNNNFNIDRSTIGVLNTGSIENLNSAVNALNNAGDESLAAAFKTMTEVVANDPTITTSDKDKVLEMMSVLAAESTIAPEKRKKFAMKAILAEIGAVVAGIESVAKMWEDCRSVIESVFQ